jgi:hypothetical protein
VIVYIKKAFKFFDGGFCFLHTLELVVREFMGNESAAVDDQDQWTVQAPEEELEWLDMRCEAVRDEVSEDSEASHRR